MKPIAASFRIILPFFFALMFCGTTQSFAQEQPDSLPLPPGILRIYLDCYFCDDDYIRTNIPFVHFVRDRDQAQVHLLITEQETGSGGTKCTLSFIGKQEFTGMNDTLVAVTKQKDTEEMKRTEFVRMMKLGLVRYALRTPASADISVTAKERPAIREAKDRWEYWVFSTEFNTHLDGEHLRNAYSLEGSISARRVTADMRLAFSYDQDYNEDYYQTTDTTSLTAISKGRSFSGLGIFSISDHWSWGALVEASSSTYSNLRAKVRSGGAIEFDYYPYSESTRRQLRIYYLLTYCNANYEEETIYDRTSENLLQHSLNIEHSQKEEWGNATFAFVVSDYPQRSNKYNMQLKGAVSIRLFEGLSVYFNSNISKIHDQLSLPKGGASPDDVLLRRRELETQYSYSMRVGLSYSFGSIFNNIVNPRFGF